MKKMNYSYFRNQALMTTEREKAFQVWSDAEKNFMRAMTREYGNDARFYRFNREKCTATPELAALYVSVVEAYQQWVDAHAI
jgi:hypothetical protein